MMPGHPWLGRLLLAVALLLVINICILFYNAGAEDSKH